MAMEAQKRPFVNLSLRGIEFCSCRKASTNAQAMARMAHPMIRRSPPVRRMSIARERCPPSVECPSRLNLMVEHSCTERIVAQHRTQKRRVRSCLPTLL